MNNKINKSFNYLLTEYKRLKVKDKNNTISKEEKVTLLKLASFIGSYKND